MYKEVKWGEGSENDQEGRGKYMVIHLAKRCLLSVTQGCGQESVPRFDTGDYATPQSPESEDIIANLILMQCPRERR
jgi:hypothetical protein